MAKKYIVSLLLKGFGSFANIFSNILIARQITSSEAGVVFYAIALSQFMAIISRGGLDVLCLRSISAMVAKPNANASPKHFFFSAFLIVSFFSLPVTALSMLIATLSNAGAAALPEVLTVVGLAVVSIAFTNIAAETLKGLGKTNFALFWQTFSQPVFFLIGVLVFRPSLSGLALLVAASFSITALLSTVHCFRSFSIKKGGVVVVSELREMALLGLPFLIIALTNGVIDISDTLLLGFLSKPEDVSVYYACAKIAALSTTILFLINSFAAPKISALFVNGLVADIYKTVDLLTKRMLLAAGVLLCAIFFLKGSLLGLFGSDYADRGSSALQVLSIGYFAVLAAGPVGIFMTMTGRQSLYLRTNLVACFVNLAVNVFLIPRYGLNGACFGTAASLVVKNLFLFVQYRKFRSECYAM